MAFTVAVFLLFLGSLYVQCCARFLLVKCQLAAPKHQEDKSRREYGKNDYVSKYDRVYICLFVTCLLPFLSSNPCSGLETSRFTYEHNYDVASLSFLLATRLRVAGHYPDLNLLSQVERQLNK